MSDLQEDIKQCKEILREIKRTDDTDGCYNPYNKVRPFLVDVVHRALLILKEAEREK